MEVGTVIYSINIGKNSKKAILREYGVVVEPDEKDAKEGVSSVMAFSSKAVYTLPADKLYSCSDINSRYMFGPDVQTLIKSWNKAVKTIVRGMLEVYDGYLVAADTVPMARPGQKQPKQAAPAPASEPATPAAQPEEKPVKQTEQLSPEEQAKAFFFAGWGGGKPLEEKDKAQAWSQLMRYADQLSKNPAAPVPTEQKTLAAQKPQTIGAEQIQAFFWADMESGQRNGMWSSLTEYARQLAKDPEKATQKLTAAFEEPEATQPSERQKTPPAAPVRPERLHSEQSGDIYPRAIGMQWTAVDTALAMWVAQNFRADSGVYAHAVADDVGWSIVLQGVEDADRDAVENILKKYDTERQINLSWEWRRAGLRDKLTLGTAVSDRIMGKEVLPAQNPPFDFGVMRSIPSSTDVLFISDYID